VKVINGSLDFMIIITVDNESTAYGEVQQEELDKHASKRFNENTLEIQ
jgi:hypothetical protein